MEIQKKRNSFRYKDERSAFLVRHDRQLALSAAARDMILPQRNVKFDVRDGFLYIIPSDNKDDYAVSLCNYNYTTKISCGYLQHFVDLPEGIRIPVKKCSDGALKIEVLT